MTTKTFREIHMDGEGFHTLGIYRLFFKAEFRAAQKRRADYDAEVADWYENGPGRPSKWVTDVIETDEGEVELDRYNVGGNGYAFPECIHGMSLVTDYDNICGGCEESMTVFDEARGYARERYLHFNDRWDWVSKAPGDLNHDTRNELLTWATSLFPKKEELS